MDKSYFQKLLEECLFFKDKEIEMSSIYFDDPIEKCFMVKDRNSDKKFKVRFSLDQFPKSVINEHNALQYLKQSGIEWVPQIYFTQLNNTIDILVYDYIEGQSIDKMRYDLTKLELSLIQKKLTIIINQFNSLSANFFGDFSGNIYPSWLSYLQSKLFNHVENSFKIGLIDNVEYQIIKTAFQSQLDYFENVKSTFLHFDIKPANILYNRDTQETNLVDFELCRFGDEKIEYSRFITDYSKPDVFHESLFIPLAKSLSNLEFDKFINSKVFHLYNLYNFLAYYTTSYLKHGVNRDYLIVPIKKAILSLK